MTTKDANQVNVAMGSYNGVATPLKIEHATGYLKAKIYNQALAAPSVTPTVAGHDNNSVHSALGTYNGAIKPLLVTHTGGYLRAVTI
jgi:hypothetical protein